MNEPPITSVLRPEPPKELNRRGAGRLSPFWLHCDRGYVLDISADGAKILSKRRYKGVISLRLWDDKRGITIEAEVAWAKKVRFRQHEIGLRFCDTDPETASQLAAIAALFHD